jgi:class 3 adenylate cyclase
LAVGRTGTLIERVTAARSARLGIWAAALGLPLALVIVLRATPLIDESWEQNSAHFWIVFSAAAASAGVALAITEAGRRRRDARLLLIGLAFVVSAGFLALHGLATPGVFVTGGHGGLPYGVEGQAAAAGFVLATPIGLVLAGALAAASAVEYSLGTSLWIVRHSWLLFGLLLAVLVAWAVDSLAQLPPLRNSVTPGRLGAPLGVVAVVGVLLYVYASLAYFRVWWRRRSALAFVVAFAFALLAEALIVSVVSLPTSWRLSWWEWHALMAISYISIGAAAVSEWREERFSALYLDETLAGRREVTVLFADLVGFTPFSESHEPDDVHAMLVGYFSELTPMISDEFGGEVHEFVGDQIFAIFNKGGDQPDHAQQAARAALALQQRAAAISSRHPDWPPFRVGVNTGAVLAGVVGVRGHRIHGVFGDTVNIGARLEGQAPPGGVVVGAATWERLPAGTEAEALPVLTVKGRAEPVSAYLLHSVADGVSSSATRVTATRRRRRAAPGR